MGNWTINISGVGAHHNNKPAIDADHCFLEFVNRLREQGHTIENATFHFGAKETPTTMQMRIERQAAEQVK